MDPGGAAKTRGTWDQLSGKHDSRISKHETIQNHRSANFEEENLKTDCAPYPMRPLPPLWPWASEPPCNSMPPHSGGNFKRERSTESRPLLPREGPNELAEVFGFLKLVRNSPEIAIGTKVASLGVHGGDAPRQVFQLYLQQSLDL